MASSVRDNINKLLEQYSFKVDPVSPYEDLTCNKCRMLIRDVYQAYCGCTYCYECISVYITKGGKYCNGNKEDCKNQVLILEGNVSRSFFLNNKILKVKVICPKESCSYTGFLVDMEDHLRRSHPYVVIGCSKKTCTPVTIENHTKDKNIAPIQVLVDWINLFRNENKSEMESMKETLNRSIKKYDREIESLKKDLRNNETRIEVQRKEIESLKDNLRNNETRIEVQRKEIVSLKDNLRNKETQIEAQKTEIWNLKRLDQKMDELSSTIDIIKERTIMSGEIIFPIDNIDDRMKIAEKEMISPYFYSHNNGYKLRLQVYPGGYNDGSGTHLSVCIQICRGEYDDMLPWPCKYSLHLSVVNQRNGATCNTMTLSRDTASNYKHNYDRPIYEDNDGYGSSKFISHSDLRTIDGIIINNMIAIKCIVTPPYSLSSSVTYRTLSDGY